MTANCGDYRRAKRDEPTIINLSFRRVKRGDLEEAPTENLSSRILVVYFRLFNFSKITLPFSLLYNLV